MGTHTVRTDCLKCDTRDSFVFSYDTKNTACNEAFCLNCGWSYKTIERKLNKEELEELRNEYEWKIGDQNGRGYLQGKIQICFWANYSGSS